MADYGVATLREQSRALREYLQSPEVEKQLLRVLPPHLSPGRAVRQVLTLCAQNPELSMCTPRSVYGCLVQAAELGLEMSGVLGQCYAIPYWNGRTRCREARFQIGYRGLITLVHRTGKIGYLTARVVHAREAWSVQYGTSPSIFHAPIVDGTDPGPAIAYYAVVSLIGGGEDFEVMTRAQVEKHRDRFSRAASSGGPSRDFGWGGHFDTMACKTVLLKLCRRLPLSVEVAEVSSLSEGSDESGQPGSVLTGPTRTDQLAEMLEGVAEAAVEEPEVVKEDEEGGVVKEVGEVEGEGKIVGKWGE